MAGGAGADDALTRRRHSTSILNRSAQVLARRSPELAANERMASIPSPPWAVVAFWIMYTQKYDSLFDVG